MYQKGAGNDKQGKDAGNRTLCPYRNFSQAITGLTDQNIWTVIILFSVYLSSIHALKSSSDEHL